MPRHFRLSRGDFAHVRGFSRTHGRLFSLSYGTIPGRSAPGAAAVVSKKVAPSAVERNRIKRRVRATLLPLLIKATKPIICIVVAKNAARGAPADAITRDLVSLCDTAHLI